MKKGMVEEEYAAETLAFRNDTFIVLFSLTAHVNHGSLIYVLFPWFHLQSSVVHKIDPQLVYEINTFLKLIKPKIRFHIHFSEPLISDRDTQSHNSCVRTHKKAGWKKQWQLGRHQHIF